MDDCACDRTVHLSSLFTSHTFGQSPAFLWLQLDQAALVLSTANVHIPMLLHNASARQHYELIHDVD